VTVRALDDVEGDSTTTRGSTCLNGPSRRTVWSSNQRVISAISASVKPV